MSACDCGEWRLNRPNLTLIRKQKKPNIDWKRRGSNYWSEHQLQNITDRIENHKAYIKKQAITAVLGFQCCFVLPPSGSAIINFFLIHKSLGKGEAILTPKVRAYRRSFCIRIYRRIYELPTKQEIAGSGDRTEVEAQLIAPL